MLSRGAQITGVGVMSLCVTWVCVILRFYVRIGILKFFGREDWLTFVAMIFMTALSSILLRTTSYGLGAHMDAIPDYMLQVAIKYTFVCELLYVVTTAVAKLSIGMFYLRLASKLYQVRIIHFTLGVVMLFSTMYFFFLLFQCTPISFIWSQYENSRGHCLSKTSIINVTYAHAAMSAFTDWTFGILPVFFVWKLKMNPRTKLSVVLILSLGFFASSATIVRIVYIRQLQLTTDYSWFGINLAKWSMVEPAIAISAAAIATLRPLFKNFRVTTKRFPNDSELSMSTERTSADTRKSGQEYSAEFAQMLGLSKYGVTTTITAGKRTSEDRWNWIWKKNPETSMRNDNESQTELSYVKSEDDGVSHFDWGSGIKRTTTVVIDGSV